MDEYNQEGQSPMPRKKTKLEQAKEKLDSSYYQIKNKKRARLHNRQEEVPHTWNDQSTPRSSSKKSSSVTHFKVFFIGALAFFVIALLIVSFSVFTGRSGVSHNAIDLEILTRSFVNGGESVEITVEVVNNNTIPLELVDLVLQYPQSARSTGTDIVRDRRSLGTLMPGVPIRENFDVILFGEEGEQRDIQAVLEYRIDGSNAIFSRDTSTSIIIQSTPIELRIAAPVNTIPNQRISFDVTLNSQSTEIMRNMLIGVEYPSGFTFESASMSPSFGENTWRIPEIGVGEEITITIEGLLQGDPNELKVFRAFIGNQNPQNERQIQTVFNSAIGDILIREAFLQLDLRMGNDDRDVVTRNSGQRAQFNLQIRNPHNEPLQNVEVFVELEGNVLDISSIDTNRGFYDSNTNTIVFNRDTDSRLSLVSPQQTITVPFEFASGSLATGTSVAQRPTMSIRVNARGIDPGGRVLSGTNMIERTVRVNSDLQLTRRSLYYGGPFANTGNFPPEVGSPTNMTLVWTVTNTSNTIEDARVTTTLPSYVTWNNRVTPSSEDIVYNSATREVTWNLGDVERGTGFSSSARTVSFQVSLTPSLSQAGSSPALTADVILEGKDTFTENTLRDINREHTTRLLNDTQSHNGQVINQ